ncbi:MAG: trypsin-like serine protease [Deltaproteobacteria bacterium]
MKRLLPLLALTFSCGAPAEYGTTTRRIIEGQPATRAEHPATVALLFVEKEPGYDDFAGVGCTGTLVAPDVILTAAHCTVDEAELADYPGLTVETYVSWEADLADFGLTTMELPADAIGVTEQIRHPQYLGDAVEVSPGLGEDRDIGLLLLGQRAGAPLAELPSAAADARVQSGEPVMIVGYGQRERQADSELYGAKYAASTFIQEVGALEMQVGGTRDSTTVGPSKCYGDSGGPTYLEHDGAPVVVGVTSRSYNLHEDCDEAGVDTRVGPFVEWIHETMDAWCAAGLRSVDCDPTKPPVEEPPVEEPPVEEPPVEEPPVTEEPPVMQPPQPMPPVNEEDPVMRGEIQTLEPQGCTSAGAAGFGALWVLFPVLWLARRR